MEVCPICDDVGDSRFLRFLRVFLRGLCRIRIEIEHMIPEDLDRKESLYLFVDFDYLKKIELKILKL